MLGRHPGMVHRARDVDPQLLGEPAIRVEVEPRMPRPASSVRPTTTAPAPSAKMTAVFRPRLLTSMPVDWTSAPTTKMRSILVGPDPGVGHGQGVHEAAALRPDIQGRNRADPEIALQVYAVPGREVVRRRGCVHDRVQLVSRGVGHLECPGRGAQRQLRTGLAFADPATLLDARAGADPLVSGVHDLREVVVGHHPIGHREAGAQQTGSGHVDSLGRGVGKNWAGRISSLRPARSASGSVGALGL